MLHLSTGLLQEYGVWQLLTALCFFLTGILIEAKFPQHSFIGRAAAALGTLLCADELLMLHECIDHLSPHVFLSMEFMMAAAIGVALLKHGYFSFRPLLVLGFLSTTAIALEIKGNGQTFVRAEESLEVVCAALGLIFAAFAKGRVNFKRIFIRVGFWCAIGSAFGAIVLAARPQVCPTVDYWSKKYFHEQIW